MVNGVGFGLGSLLLHVGGFLCYGNEDVRGAYEVFATELLEGTVVHAVSDGVDVSLVHHVGRELHVAVGAKLLLEAAERVKPRGLGGRHLELVVDEHRHVFSYGLLLHSTLYAAVFIIGILKFGFRHGLAVDGHQHGV